jgi:hypothetical protein
LTSRALLPIWPSLAAGAIFARAVLRLNGMVSAIRLHPH